MPIDFKCPHCQVSLQAVSGLAGKPSMCPKCNKEITVPAQDAGTQSKEKETAKKE
jgi:hypothetical protein